MAFAVDQGCKQAVIGCFFTDHDPAKTTFRTHSWISGKTNLENDMSVQEKRSSASDSGTKLSADVPHWMTFDQALNFQANTGGAKTPDVAPCTPVSSFSRSKVQSEPTSGLPSLCLSIGSSGKLSNQNMEMLPMSERAPPCKAFSDQLEISPPHSLSSKPCQNATSQEHMPSSEDLLSLFLSKQQPKGDQATRSSLVTSQLAGNFSQNSRVPAVPFLENFASNDVQSAKTPDVDHHKLLLETNYRSLNPSACNMTHDDSFRQLFSGNAQPPIGDSRQISSPCKPGLCSSPSALKNGAAFPTNVISGFSNGTPKSSFTSHAVQSTETPYFSPSRACTPSLINDWSGAKPVSKPQILPDIFAHQELNVSSKSGNHCRPIEDRVHPEKKCRLFISQDSMLSGSCHRYSSPRCDDSAYINENHNNEKTKRMHQQTMETVQMHQSPRVKLELQYDDTVCSKYATDSSQFVNFTEQPSSRVSILNSSNAIVSTVGHAQSNIATSTSGVVGALISSMPVRYTFNYAQRDLPADNLEELSQQPQRTIEFRAPNVSSSSNGDWGKFLALSAAPDRHSTGIRSEIVLPFQRRFQQLQEFLKQCDESDGKYNFEALKSLTPSERNGRAVELETRAVKLSLEEGKELKRMKSLNILGKNPEGSYLCASLATPNGPKLPAPGIAVQVKQES